MEDAEHPAADCLYAVIAAVSELEQQLLLQPAVLPDAAWQEQPSLLPQRVGQVQVLRAALWRCCHGPLHAPWGVVRPALAASSHSAALQATSLDLEYLCWLWTRLDKALRAVLQLPAVAEALLLGAAGQLAARLDYVRGQMSAALGLAERPAKPLAWRLCGRPQLPSSLRLLEAQLGGQALAAVMSLQGTDAQGRPTGLPQAGVDLGRVIAEAAGRLAPAYASAGSIHAVNDGADNDMDAGGGGGSGNHAPGSVAESLAEILSGGGPSAQVQERVALAVQAALRCDTGLRRAVAHGLAMLGFMPMLALLQPASPAKAPIGPLRQQAEGSLADQGCSIVSELEAQLRARVAAAAEQALACASEQDWLNQQQQVQVLRQGAAAAAAPRLLPAKWMASATCRQLQVTGGLTVCGGMCVGGEGGALQSFGRLVCIAS